MRARLAALLSPANSSGCGSTGASGAGGRSRHTASTGLESTGTKLAAGALAGAGEAVVAVDGHQPGIEAELAALGQVLGDPRLGRFLGDLMRHEGVGVDLGAHRQRVAAVDEDRRAIGQHDGKAGRAAEAGEPGEPLRAPRHVLALMLVGARHHEAVEAALPELGAQRGQARHRRRRGAEPVIGPRQLLAPGLERPGELGDLHWDRPVRPIRDRPGPRGLRQRRASGNRGPRDPGFGHVGGAGGGRRLGRNSCRRDPTRQVWGRQSEQFSFSRDCEMRNQEASCVKRISVVPSLHLSL